VLSFILFDNPENKAVVMINGENVSGRVKLPLSHFLLKIPSFFAQDFSKSLIRVIR